VGLAATRAVVDPTAGGSRVSARVTIDDAVRWWPHTHGRPFLYSCGADLSIAGETFHVDAGAAGFRTLRARREDEGFALEINDTPVFCRGACWTVSDIVSLDGGRPELAGDLERLRDAGANMVRVGGTMLYESDAFYRLCDELGLLVWQDFMFANMDYPADAAAFLDEVRIEAAEQLRRLRPHPSLTVYCGNSEVEQQAAMLGVDRQAWRSRLFAEVLPEACATWHPGVPYVPSTPSGGDLPFHTGSGVTHYYGVGAYRRPIEDARRARVRFTPECLGFANVPAPAVVAEVMQGERVAIHDPRWKTRTPRDTGAGWDFEDIRDHYLGALFSVDPVQLRSADPERYLALGRLTTGEVMARVFAEWRSARSSCRGGLVWFLKDLWPGAGWGVLDSHGGLKACFHYLRRVWQPRTVVMTDEGLDGLHCHVINETAEPLSGTLDMTLVGDGLVRVAEARVPCEVEPRATTPVSVDAALGRFYDLSYAYRFGPPSHDVVRAALHGPSDEMLAETFWIRDLAVVARQSAGAVVAAAEAIGAGAYELSLTSDRFLFAVHVDADGFFPSDDYFCLMPGHTKAVRLAPRVSEPAGCDGYVEALNLEQAVRIETRAVPKVPAS
jgi:beta-mannosidase